MMKNKKGQFYILTAVILLSVLFSIVQTSNISLKSSSLSYSNTKELYNNEAKNIINNAIYSDKNINETLETLTKNYIKFKNDKNEKLLILYLYKDDNQIIISNHLNKEVLINPNNITLENNNLTTILLNNLSLSFDGQNHQIIWGSYPKEFKSIIIEEK